VRAQLLKYFERLGFEIRTYGGSS